MYFSAASIWEAEIKAAAGKLTIPEELLDALDADGFIELPLAARHAREAARLPPLHRDPFDRMLVAQARAEGIAHRAYRLSDLDRMAVTSRQATGAAATAGYSSSTILRARKSKICSTSRPTNSLRAISPRGPKGSA